MKDFVPYDTALALKELGFDEPCFGYYNNNNKFTFFVDLRNCNTNSEFEFFPIAPTFSQAFRWFREKYNLNFECKTPDGKDGKWFPEIHKIYGFGNYFDNDGFDSYEEAELTCLKKLIEIVKK